MRLFLSAQLREKKAKQTPERLKKLSIPSLAAGGRRYLSMPSVKRRNA